MPKNHPSAGSESDRTNRFLHLYSVAQPRLFAYILAMIPRWHDAEEVLQETSVVLWKSFDRFEEGTNFWAWAKTTALHQVLSFRKRQKKQAMPLERKFIEAVSKEYGRMADDLEEQLLALAECVDKLPAGERDLIVACYEPETTIREVAARLGRPEGTVYKSLTRIRRELLDCIERSVSEGGPKSDDRPSPLSEDGNTADVRGHATTLSEGGP